MNILRYKTAAQKCDVSIITIRRWATQAEYAHLNFPKPMDLTENVKGFVEQEINDWLADRVAKRDDDEDDENDEADDERPP